MQKTWDASVRALHWLSALYILGMIADGYWMNHAVPREGKLAQFHWHAYFGVYFALLVLIRLVRRLTSTAPALPKAMSRWERFAASAMQWLSYALMIAIPVFGWITWSARTRHLPVFLFGVLELPWAVAQPNSVLEHRSEDIHIYMAYALLALVALHVAAALNHHFVRRDDVLSRMLGR